MSPLRVYPFSSLVTHCHFVVESGNPFISSTTPHDANPNDCPIGPTFLYSQHKFLYNVYKMPEKPT